MQYNIYHLLTYLNYKPHNCKNSLLSGFAVLLFIVQVWLDGMASLNQMYDFTATFIKLFGNLHLTW